MPGQAESEPASFVLEASSQKGRVRVCALADGLIASANSLKQQLA